MEDGGVGATLRVGGRNVGAAALMSCTACAENVNICTTRCCRCRRRRRRRLRRR